MTASATHYFCPTCGSRRLLVAPCGHVDITTSALTRVRELLGTNEAEHRRDNAEQWAKTRGSKGGERNR